METLYLTKPNCRLTDAFRRPTRCHHDLGRLFSVTKRTDLSDAFRGCQVFDKSYQSSPVFPGTGTQTVTNMEIFKYVHQMDPYPAVSMLHVLSYTVRAFSLEGGQPWFGQTACTLLANSFSNSYMLYLAESDRLI